MRRRCCGGGVDISIQRRMCVCLISFGVFLPYLCSVLTPPPIFLSLPMVIIYWSHRLVRFFCFMDWCTQLAFSFVTTFNCDFLNFGGFDIASLGLWYYGIGGECQTTKFEAADDGLIAGARSCITISMICGAGSMFLITFEWLCCEICCAGILEGIGIACAWIFGA